MLWLDAVTGCRDWMPWPDAVTQCRAWLPCLNAVTRCRAWIPAWMPWLDAVTGSRAWMPWLDAVPGWHAWMPSLDAVPGCRAWMPWLDAVTWFPSSITNSGRGGRGICFSYRPSEPDGIFLNLQAYTCPRGLHFPPSWRLKYPSYITAIWYRCVYERLYPWYREAKPISDDKNSLSSLGPSNPLIPLMWGVVATHSHYVSVKRGGCTFREIFSGSY